MNYVEILKDMQATGCKYNEALPQEMKAFGKMHDEALKDAQLDPKTKEFIALGISIAIKCDPCIVAHTASLIELGATRKEIVETLGVALFMGGGPATAYGAKALECYDQLSEALK